MQIITDCAADMPQEELELYGIIQMPLFIQFPEGEVSSTDLTPDEFYTRLEKMRPVIPTTSMPGIKLFLDVYHKLASQAERILSVHISSGLSGTIDSARGAAAQSETSSQIGVWDTMTLSGAERYQVLAAAMAAKKGWSMESILKRLEEIRSHTEIVFTLETLEYLARGGRIGRVQALAGTLLNIKPIIRVDHKDGKYSNVGRSRTVNQAIKNIGEYLHGVYAHTPMIITILHGRFAEKAAMLEEELKSRLNIFRMETLRVSPVLGVHTGPGVVGVAAVPAEFFEDLTS